MSAWLSLVRALQTYTLYTMLNASILGIIIYTLTFDVHKRRGKVEFNAKHIIYDGENRIAFCVLRLESNTDHVCSLQRSRQGFWMICSLISFIADGYVMHVQIDRERFR